MSEEIKYFSQMPEVPDFDLSEPFYKEGVKWTTRHNFELEKKHVDKVVIHDVTLRDGDQTPGSVFLEDERLRIADALAEMKVPRIEAGMPNVSKAVENSSPSPTCRRCRRWSGRRLRSASRSDHRRTGRRR